MKIVLSFLVPDPVADVSVSTLGPESLRVSWIPAESADENITHYVFTVTDKDDSDTCVRIVVISRNDASDPVSIAHNRLFTIQNLKSRNQKTISIGYCREFFQ